MEIIIGVAVSSLAQFLKKAFPGKEYVALAIVAVLALLSAYIYTLLVVAGYWQSVLQILTTAGAFYTFVLARFKAA